MDISKWKSLAIRLEDHRVLKLISKEKFRGPSAMFTKILHDYVSHLARKKGYDSKELFIRQLEMNERTKVRK